MIQIQMIKQLKKESQLIGRSLKWFYFIYVSKKFIFFKLNIDYKKRVLFKVVF